MSTTISTVTYDQFVSDTDNKENFEIDPASFEILSTIRYDPSLTITAPQNIEDVSQQNFFLFPEHVERLKYSLNFFLEAASRSSPQFSAGSFDIGESYIYGKLVQALQESGISLAHALKIRLLVSLDGTVNVELYETPPRQNLLDGFDHDYPPERNYDVYVDTTPVLASPFTSFKTTSRKVYSDARSRALPGHLPREEVILVNTLGEVTEGSITNIAIRNKSGDWVTPQLTSGCLCGVTRYFLLKKNLVKESSIRLDNLKVGQEVLLLNAILGVVRGTIRGFVGAH